MSGPAILQVSSYWRHGQPVIVDFLPRATTGWLREAKRKRPRASLPAVLGEHLPARLADTLAERLAIAVELGNAPDKVLAEAEKRLACWRFAPSGTEGFAKAEVTVGGIATTELSQQSLEARKVPGLFVIGEAVDVTGWLGGYNFQWAWASAVAAGQAL
jgi:predicted Rossmann fold flavoprotein